MDPHNSKRTSNSSQDDLKTPSGGNRRQALVEDVVNAFHEVVTPNPGFREGSTRAPDLYREAIEVTSWLQVPSILNKLQSGEAQNIRLLFPTPKVSTVLLAEHIDAFVDEQFAIADFIKAHHAEPIDTIRDLLAQKIEKSFSLALARATKEGAEDLTGTEWVNATLPPAPASKSLSVTTFLPVGQKAITTEATVNSLIVSLLESVQKERPIAITIADTDPARLAELAVLLDTLQGPESVLHDVRQGMGLHTKIWVGPYTAKLNTKHPVNTPCPEVKEYSFQEFIDKFKPKGSGSSPGAGGPTPPRPPSNGPTPKGAQGAGASADAPPPGSGPTPSNSSPHFSAGSGEGSAEQKPPSSSEGSPPKSTPGDKTGTPPPKEERPTSTSQEGSAESPLNDLKPPPKPQSPGNEPPPRKHPTLQEHVNRMAEEARSRRARFGSKKEEDIEISTPPPTEEPRSSKRW